MQNAADTNKIFRNNNYNPNTKWYFCITAVLSMEPQLLINCNDKINVRIKLKANVSENDS